MRLTKKLYTIVRVNNGEVVASDLVLQDAINVVGCKYKEVLIQKASEGKAYKGFRIIQKDNPDYIAKDNKVTVQLDNGEMREVPFTWVWQRVQEQKGNFRKKVQHG